jgi:putative membrane protein
VHLTRPAFAAPGNRTALVTGLVLAAIVLSPPIEAWTGRSLAGHMAQHVVLVGGVAPLLALGAPEPARTGGAGLLAAGVAAQTATVIGWHAPPLFDAAEDMTVVHVAEHLCLLAGAWLLWWAAARAGGPAGRGPGALATFVALLPLTVLGVGLVLAGTPWYTAHRDLADQQMAGVVMWAGGGLLALAGALGLGVSWVVHTVGDDATRPEAADLHGR